MWKSWSPIKRQPERRSAGGENNLIQLRNTGRGNRGREREICTKKLSIIA